MKIKKNKSAVIIRYPTWKRKENREKRDAAAQKEKGVVSLPRQSLFLRMQPFQAFLERLLLAGHGLFLLLDEPLSALDGVIKESIKERIKTIAREYHLTTIIVTHDPEEALTLSDRVLIIDGGRIAQYGQPSEIIHRPNNDFVRRFILNQLEIKRNNIYALFGNTAAIGAAV